MDKKPTTAQGGQQPVTAQQKISTNQTSNIDGQSVATSSTKNDDKASQLTQGKKNGHIPMGQDSGRINPNLPVETEQDRDESENRDLYKETGFDLDKNK